LEEYDRICKTFGVAADLRQVTVTSEAALVPPPLLADRRQAPALSLCIPLREVDIVPV
jgi:hypothetical protein